MAQLAINTEEVEIVAGIVEMQRLILAAYPEARFEVEIGEDPIATYLLANVDEDDLDAVMDVYVDRLIDLQVNDGLKLHVLPIQKRDPNGSRSR